jgi:pimeloyl-ACP methyl ester carboxylesterase
MFKPINQKMMRKIFVTIFAGVITLSCNNPGSEKKSVSAADVLIENKGVNISYTDTGVGDTTLLFVHGWCINKTYWTGQSAYFKSRYRVVTVDLPGFGQSGKNRTVWTTEEYGRDIDSVLVKLNLINVILVGHSMAGDIVLQAAINAPERVIGLVGVDNFTTVGHVQTKVEKENFAKVIDMLKHNFTQITIQYFNEDLFSKTTADSIKKRILHDVMNADTVIAAVTIEQQDLDEVKKLTEVNKKLFLINSDVHPTDTTGFVTNKIPYRVYFVHGTGHYPMVEAPDEFNALLERVISDQK